MAATRDWYGKDWKILRTQLVKLCLVHCENLLSALKKSGHYSREEFTRFIDVVREDIFQRTMEDKLGLWENCLPLMSDVSKLELELKKDKKTLSGQTEKSGKATIPVQAFARILKQFFELSRRQIVADDLGVSSNKVKTWERLDKISRQLCKDKNITNRCREDHFEELAGHVKSHYGHDKNLPRRANKVMEYFYRFSDDCIQFIDEFKTAENRLSLQETQSIFANTGMKELVHCLEELNEDECQLIDLFFNVGLSRLVYRTVDDYLAQHNITMSQLHKKRNAVIDKLRRSLELKVEGRQWG
ncbi:MAG: hypothetical protein CSA32_04135 [Desulfobulbus propionicus]|nr:MAG: hypothetical protein CSA32_04135 [Desulfobulbus propionicus]